MALFHFHMGQIRRSAGQSAIAAAAYRAGERLYSDYYDEFSDYTKKGGVIYTEILLPPNASRAYLDRATLWNAVEQTEKHPQAQLAYSFDIALQNEFTLEENISLAKEFVQRYLVGRGMIADLAVHIPDKEGGILNPHFHVLTTMRPLNPDGAFGAKQRREYVLDENGERVRDERGHCVFNAVHTTDWHEPETLEHWREAWCEMVNAKFAEKGLDCRIEHRSYMRQGVEQIPTVHEGPNVRKMEARGIQTEKGELNRWIKDTNRIMANLKRNIKHLLAWIAELKEALQPPKETNLIPLLFACLDQRNQGAWSKRVRARNLKEMNRICNYLQENNLSTLEALEERIKATETAFHALNTSMRQKSVRMKTLQTLQRHAEHYAATKPIYDQLRGIRWKKQRATFQREHDGDLRLFYTARRQLREQLGNQPIDRVAWKQEYNQLNQAYQKDYDVYRSMKADVAQLRKIRHWVDKAQEIPAQTRHTAQEVRQ